MKKRKAKYIRRVVILLFLALVIVQGITEKSRNRIVPTIQDSLLQVHFLDVGQADCTLIESEGEFMIVDAGNEDDQETVISYLKDQGVEKLKYVIGTHPHEDHIGSLDEVIAEFEVETVILPDTENTTEPYQDLKDAIRKKNLDVTAPIIGELYELGGGDFEIIAPVNEYGTDYNAWSVGIKVVAGETSFVLCGDATNEAEKDICKSGTDIEADVLKINHHGSANSSNNEFLEEVNPDYAVIFCGDDNSYGHPHKEILDKLEEAEITIFRTDEHGTIVAKTNGKTISFFKENNNKYGKFIKYLLK